MMSLHNFIIGTPYIDIGERMIVTKLDTNLKCVIDFERRGWFAKDKEIAKVEGKVFTHAGNETNGKEFKKSMKDSATWHVQGNWNGSISLGQIKPVKLEPEVVWTKAAYPDQADQMYGMSHFSLQMNYFPKRLAPLIAPTDTRRRPD